MAEELERKKQDINNYDPKEFDIDDEDRTLIRYEGKDSTVFIPEGVEIIDEYAFDDTPAKRIVLPESVQAIDRSAFNM